MKKVEFVLFKNCGKSLSIQKTINFIKGIDWKINMSGLQILSADPCQTIEIIGHQVFSPLYVNIIK